ncbi:MAG: hypothetical protein IKW54_05745 [Bacteroidales bacterium]|nr:hypothetical protein [Bacteroidales bacterium]
MTLFYILGLTIALCFIAVKVESIFVSEDGIEIKDNMYPLYIPNDIIVSVTLLNSMPRILMKTNGANFGRIFKGKCKIMRNNATEKVTMYLRNKMSNVIEIKTVNGSVFINRKNDALTQQLFDEMKSTVKIVKESELDYCSKPRRNYRSTLMIVAFTAALLGPLFFMNYNSEIIVTDNVIEIKGEYAMTIPFSDIDTVLLIEKLPPIKTRTNGISTRKVNIGKFKMSNGQKANLYINKDVPLFIEIKCQQTTDNGQQTSSKSSLIYVNGKTVEDTKALYEEINSVKN